MHSRPEAVSSWVGVPQQLYTRIAAATLLLPLSLPLLPIELWLRWMLPQPLPLLLPLPPPLPLLLLLLLRLLCFVGCPPAPCAKARGGGGNWCVGDKNCCQWLTPYSSRAQTLCG